MYRLTMSSRSSNEANEIEQKLVAWGRARDQLEIDRDRLVLEAYADDPNVRRIHLLAGISRSTIYRILDKHGIAVEKQPRKG